MSYPAQSTADINLTPLGKKVAQAIKDGDQALTDSLMKGENMPPLQSKWKEVDPRVDRVIVVKSHDIRGQMVGIIREDPPGARRHKIIKVTWAKVERFNSKRGGYAPVVDHEAFAEEQAETDKADAIMQFQSGSIPE